MYNKDESIYPFIATCYKIIILNVTDSDESVRKEVSIMVPQFCFDHWKQTEEPMFRNGRVRFNDKQFIHSAHES